jgi:hypothetical protein
MLICGISDPDPNPDPEPDPEAYPDAEEGPEPGPKLICRPPPVFGEAGILLGFARRLTPRSSPSSTISSPPPISISRALLAKEASSATDGLDDASANCTLISLP